jgi:hypothetical protein
MNHTDCPLCNTQQLTQPPLALAVPLSRFTPRVGGGSAFFVRPKLPVSNYELNWQTDYMKKHTMIIGSLLGLAAGIFMFETAGLLPFGSSLWPIFHFINRPVLLMVDWLARGFQHADFSEWLAAYLCYWVALGFMVGFGCWVIGKWRRMKH